MTEQQKKFFEEYAAAADFNGKEAAIRAGYAPSNARFTASRLLAKPEGQEYLQEIRSEQKAKTGVTTQRVIEGFLKEAEYDGVGASHAARVQAWNGLARCLGMFVDKLALTDPTGRKQYNPLTNDERARLNELIAKRGT
jgi:hypothetical protein